MKEDEKKPDFKETLKKLFNEHPAPREFTFIMTPEQDRLFTEAIEKEFKERFPKTKTK